MDTMDVSGLMVKMAVTKEALRSSRDWPIKIAKV